MQLSPWTLIIVGLIVITLTLMMINIINTVPPSLAGGVTGFDIEIVKPLNIVALLAAIGGVIYGGLQLYNERHAVVEVKTV